MKFFSKITGTFADGVSVGKRISYGVFRNLVVPEIGKVTNRTTDEVVAIIASDKVVVPMVVSAHNTGGPLTQTNMQKQQSAHFENL
jgi:hypothetical protein